MKRILTLLVMTSVSTAAFAQSLPTAPYLPLEMAITAAQKAIETCSANGHNVSVAIVARSGETKVLLRADNAGPHTVGSSIGKGFTSASLGRDTASLAGFIGAKPENSGLRDMDSRLVIQAGGLPIKFEGKLVGGIGVGGAPSGTLDAECARKGLNAIEAE